MSDLSRDRRRHLALLTGDAKQPSAPTPDAKQHPPGVWDLPAAVGYRRLTAIDTDGNMAIEMSISDRVPEEIRRELRWYVERALEQALIALRV